MSSLMASTIWLIWRALRIPVACWDGSGQGCPLRLSGQPPTALQRTLMSVRLSERSMDTV